MEIDSKERSVHLHTGNTTWSLCDMESLCMTVSIRVHAPPTPLPTQEYEDNLDSSIPMTLISLGSRDLYT